MGAPSCSVLSRVLHSQGKRSICWSGLDGKGSPEGEEKGRNLGWQSGMKLLNLGHYVCPERPISITNRQPRQEAVPVTGLLLQAVLARPASEAKQKSCILRQRPGFCHDHVYF